MVVRLVSHRIISGGVLAGTEISRSVGKRESVDGIQTKINQKCAIQSKRERHRVRESEGGDYCCWFRWPNSCVYLRADGLGGRMGGVVVVDTLNTF